MKKFIDVYCIRDNEKFKIYIDNNGKEYELYYTDVPKIESNLKLIKKNTEKEFEIDDPIKGKRTYFVVKMSGYEDEIFAERKLPLKGVCNFRDLGGFRTTEEKRVKWDKFYRSDALNVLTKDDIKYLEDIGIKGILDYRAKSEAEQEKDLEIKGAMYFNVPAMKNLEKNNQDMKGNFNMEFLFKNLDKIPQLQNPTKFMIENYKSMAFENEAFKKMIELMQNENDIPFIQHCTSGKDRTGIGSAMVLLVLGVSLEKAKEDYLASNDYRREYNESVKAKLKNFLINKEREDLIDLMLDVKEEYFNATFDTIFSKYSTLEDYFEAEYDLTKEKINNLKERYLY